MEKENIYINLQGKTKEELTDLYEFLTSNGEKPYRDLESFLDYGNEAFEPIGFTSEYFCGLGRNSVGLEEVTIQQLKQIIKPMENKEFDLSMCRVQVDKEEQAKQLQEYAFSQGFYWKSGKIKGSKLKNLDYPYYYFCSTDNSITYCDNDFNNGKYKEIHFNDIFKTEPTLTEQLQKAEAEVKRLKEAIEEENKPKIGDWVYNKEEDIIYQKSYNIFNQYEKKITNPELIKLLEQEIK